MDYMAKEVVSYSGGFSSHEERQALLTISQLEFAACSGVFISFEFKTCFSKVKLDLIREMYYR